VVVRLVRGDVVAPLAELLQESAPAGGEDGELGVDVVELIEQPNAVLDGSLAGPVARVPVHAEGVAALRRHEGTLEIGGSGGPRAPTHPLVSMYQGSSRQYTGEIK
jgi:hypothetical protein